MREHTKAIKRQLRELNSAAHEAALRRELLAVARQFEQWQQGKLNSFELAELIHEFHHGPARKLYNRYVDAGGLEELNVAAAVVDGLLSRDKIPPEVLTAIGDCITMLERNRASDDQAGSSPLDASL